MLLDMISGQKMPESERGFNVNTAAPRGLMSLLQIYQRAAKLEMENRQNSPETIVSPKILRDLLAALCYRDENTFFHSRRVSLIAQGLARQLCWNPEAQRELELAALLHDVGKIGIPDHLLFKPGALTPEETTQMDLLAMVSEDILEICHVPRSIREMIVDSRKPYSGMEDADRPLGKNLSLGSRILAVADAYESMTRKQIYREARTQVETFNFLRENSGILFDASVVKALFRWLGNGGQEVLNESERNRSLDEFPDHEASSLVMSTMGNVFSHVFTLENAYDGWVIIDAEQKILLANRGCRKMFGREDENVVGERWNGRNFPQSDARRTPLDENDLPLIRSFRRGTAGMTEICVIGTDGEWRQLEVQSVPLFDHEGRLIAGGEFYRFKNHNRVESAQLQQLTKQANRDALTGVANRGALEHQLTTIMSRYRDDPESEYFSAIFLDIDHFKPINDTYGHAVGDDVLVTLSRLLREEVYSSEFIARYGGEEFVMVCPGLRAEQAVKRAETIREEITKLRFESDPRLAITSSFGVSEVHETDSVESLLKRADQALYNSKDKGRNRTTVLKYSDVQRQHEKRENEKRDPFRFEEELVAMLFDNFLSLKLQSFVQETEARILKVEKGEALFQVGKRRRLRKAWGRKEEEQPLQIRIDAADVVKSGKKRERWQRVRATITPIGKPLSPKQFRVRAESTYRILRSCLLSQK